MKEQERNKTQEETIAKANQKYFRSLVTKLCARGGKASYARELKRKDGSRAGVTFGEPLSQDGYYECIPIYHKCQPYEKQL